MNPRIFDKGGLFVAGSETTASTLAFVFHLLGGHPEAERRVHAELDEVLDGRTPSYADIPGLDYTQRGVTESLRLYPPAWLFTRTTVETAALAGRELPPRSDILISPYVLHHNPALFTDPESFDPDRWLPERAKDVARGSCLPFGAGSRKCIGDVFGMTEATLALAAVASRRRLRPVPNSTIRPRPHMSLSSGPLLTVPEPR